MYMESIIPNVHGTQKVIMGYAYEYIYQAMNTSSGL